MKAALFILVVSIVAIAFSLMPPRDGEAQSQLPKKEVKPDRLKAEADSIVLQAVENNARAKVIADYASYNTEESNRFLKLIDLFIRKNKRTDKAKANPAKEYLPIAFPVPVTVQTKGITNVIHVPTKEYEGTKNRTKMTRLEWNEWRGIKSKSDLAYQKYLEK
ncbi:MAG TPA: hypothetical protein PLV31_01445 [Gammaproteobacteria bacterium]|nr:hypothetical protein [Niabella sp.]HQX21659.1 hypothetical protein [Niabella sp.]HRA42338.1 hypothetical protein [Gammaproteobacteria bacterium]HRB44156.1 hypothetical protein [Niabella sp.]HRC03045.1 hypothetical protein [Niabella sp.]